MAKKKRKQDGIVVPREIAYGLILSIIAGAWASFNQLQSVDRRLAEVEESINVIVGK